MQTSSHATEDINFESRSKNLTCWEQGERMQSLRAELSGGGVFLFPYGFMLNARLTPGERNDTLEIIFVTHRVRIHGKSLSELCSALQHFTVNWVKELPPKFEPLSDKNAAYIEHIQIEERDSNAST